MIYNIQVNIDTADHVKHRPSGETWLVAYVQGDRLAWCGWPEGEAALADCTLVKKATPEERDKLLLELADCTNDRRGRYARQRLNLTDCPRASRLNMDKAHAALLGAVSRKCHADQIRHVRPSHG